MTNSNKPTDRTSAESEHYPEVPLEILLSDDGGECCFAIHTDNVMWFWEYRDEKNSVRCKSPHYFSHLKDALEDIRDVQKRIGDLSTPILRIV